MDAVDYLREACQFAASFSGDMHTQNGAVLVPKKGKRVVSANMLPPIHKYPERLERPLKYLYLEHAERNVIYAAAREGVRTDGATLYCPWFACADCARAIIQAGIRSVVGHSVPRHLTPIRWQESISAADQMLYEAGVQTHLIGTPLGVSILFNGQQLEF